VIDVDEQITPFTQESLIGQIRQTFADLPDARSGDGVYQKYDMSDAALSAFSVFLCKLLPFWITKKYWKNNAEKIMPTACLAFI